MAKHLLLSVLLASMASASEGLPEDLPLEGEEVAQDAPEHPVPAWPLLGHPYAGQLDIATITKVPVFGKTNVVARTIMLVRFSQDEDGRIIQQHEVCTIKSYDDTKIAETIIPEAFVKAQSSPSYPVILTHREDGRVGYYADPGPSWLGVDPEVTGGVLPKKKKAPGIIDADGDGYPGGTVHIDVPLFKSVDIYVIQHGHSVFSGVLNEEGGMTGSVNVITLDQWTVGASAPFFKGNPPVTFQPDDSRFTLIPMESEAGCDEAVAQLLEPNPFG